jgi:hypothetical protein
MTKTRKVPDVVAPQGRFIAVSALEALVERWRAKGWDVLLDGMYTGAMRECADDLERLLKRKKHDRRDTESDEPSAP